MAIGDGGTAVLPAERWARVDRPSADRKMPAGDGSLSDTTRLLRGELAPLSEAIRLDVVVASETDADTGGRAAAKAASNARRTTEESFFGSIVVGQPNQFRLALNFANNVPIIQPSPLRRM